MAWVTLPPQIDEVRRRWADAPRTLGPWSRKPESVALVRQALADVRILLDWLDTTHGDPIADLCDRLAATGAIRITIVADVPGKRERSRYSVTWRLYGATRVSEGWCPAVALRRAVRDAERVSAVAA